VTQAFSQGGNGAKTDQSLRGERLRKGQRGQGTYRRSEWQAKRAYQEVIDRAFANDQLLRFIYRSRRMGWRDWTTKQRNKSSHWRGRFAERVVVKYRRRCGIPARDIGTSTLAQITESRRSLPPAAIPPATPKVVIATYTGSQEAGPLLCRRITGRNVPPPPPPPPLGRTAPRLTITVCRLN